MLKLLKQLSRFLKYPPVAPVVNQNLVSIVTLLKSAHLLTEINQTTVKQFDFKYNLNRILLALKNADLLTQTHFTELMIVLEQDDTGKISAGLAESFEYLDNEQFFLPAYFEIVIKHPLHALSLAKGLKALDQAQLLNENHKIFLETYPMHAETLGLVLSRFAEHRFLTPIIQTAIQNHPVHAVHLMQHFFSLPNGLQNSDNLKKLIRYLPVLNKIKMDWGNIKIKKQEQFDDFVYSLRTLS